ncbi:hypothetical protein BB560_007130 [Smittium megazygosporum]|uniref:Uncharacterized protein n=1 Tax=Smittium megazygosporum TaxID=133381 RepID=A0A2T9XYM0_9FUNG|nr:hypothetical protein BB560_007130 [Smittium megazygosporum]
MKHSVTGKSPAEILYGVKINMPSTWNPSDEVESVEEHALERTKFIKVYIQKIMGNVIEQNAVVKPESKKLYERNVALYVFKIGDYVLKKIGQEVSKYGQIWGGPYRIVNVGNKGVYIIQDLDGNKDSVNGDRLKLYHCSGSMIP